MLPAMTAPLLEAVPNFSEGRDLAVVEAIADGMRKAGVEVLDWSADPDHNRSVITVVGPADRVEEAAVVAARLAIERIDLRTHTGVHPRVGALDVLPVVPLAGTPLDRARASARRVGERLAAEVGLPVFFYGAASEPPGRSLAELRRGGFETLSRGWPDGRAPDIAPADWAHPGAHPSAGATCVGARRVLLAWNVIVDGLDRRDVVAIAAVIRERGGGFPGLRALGLELESRGLAQVSMNLEDPATTSPAEVFERIESLVLERGGRVVETEVIGMLPDELVVEGAAARFGGRGWAVDRLLSRRVASYLAEGGEHRSTGKA
jgi:glutamate formiminotransferase